MSQIEFAVFDEYGVDPLKDVFSNNIDKIGYIREHVVTQDDVGNIDRLSLEYYSTQVYGFAILRYNGILHEDYLEIGSTIKIPDLTAIKAEIRNRAKRQPTQVTI
jgi:hypothetical protein